MCCVQYYRILGLCEWQYKIYLIMCMCPLCVTASLSSKRFLRYIIWEIVFTWWIPLVVLWKIKTSLLYSELYILQVAKLIWMSFGTYFSLLCFHCVNCEITKKLTCFLGNRIAWHLICWKSLNTCIDLLSTYELLSDVLVILICSSKGCFLRTNTMLRFVKLSVCKHPQCWF